jgi:nucleotide-binding universal stress UspA family protein
MFNAIVVGTDGSDTATEAFAQACAIAKSVGASLHVVSAYDPVGGAHFDEEGARVGVSPTIEVDAILQAAAGKGNADGVEVDTYARKGDPSDAILDVADEQSADLIIVGNKGMTGAKRFLLGSVPDKISHHANCSVMIVRTN